MAVKYRCTKCDRKFIEWGVAKVKSGKACEDCHGEYLQQVGYDAAAAAPRKKPALKRKRVRVAAEEEVAPTLASFDQDEVVMPDLNTISVGGGTNLAEEFEAPETVEVEASADDEEEGEPVAIDEDAATVEDVIAIKPVVDEEEEEEDDE